MVDEYRRNRLADLLRTFINGDITNDQFEENALGLCSKPDHWQDDPVVSEVVDYSWLLYSDLCEHYLVGKHRLSLETRRVVTRWILFLYSDREYEWPFRKFSFLRFFLNLMTFGLWSHITLDSFGKEFRSAGDLDFWPFICKADYNAELKCPFNLAKTA